MPRPIITLLTDFGLRDHYVAAMKGVILGICPEACLVDISHEIEAFNIQQAAWTLAQACECFPPGTVHLVVVDPGVGSGRRPLAAQAGSHFFVGPDNGVLAGILDSHSNPSVYQITAPKYFRHPVSTTFHGRDIFAPIAAHLATGLDIAQVGDPVAEYVRLATTAGTVVSVDRFGNIVTNLHGESFRWIAEQPFEMHLGSHVITAFAENYSDARENEYFVTIGSAGFLEVSLNRRSAAESLDVKPGMTVLVRHPDAGTA
ncbi:MAG: SAM-dependent chlorinase/fluorinase [Acidobacteriota bacterium]|nr:SAM-dependent chlorinase/fluorinase [Acidobacteriota bacterium]